MGLPRYQYRIAYAASAGCLGVSRPRQASWNSLRLEPTTSAGRVRHSVAHVRRSCSSIAPSLGDALRS